MRLGPQQPPSPADVRAGLEAVCAIRNATDKDRRWSVAPSDWLEGAGDVGTGNVNGGLALPDHEASISGASPAPTTDEHGLDRVPQEAA